MITIFNRREVYMGFSIEKFAEIRNILSDNHTKYDYKLAGQGSSGLFGSRESLGFIGENLIYAYEYHVYVHKNDYDQAIYVINR